MIAVQIAEKVKKAIESDPNKDYIKSIYLFGSYLHGTAKKNSDVDLLFETKKTMSLFKICDTEYHLSKALGKKVDFVPKNSLIKQLKKIIISEAKKIYEN